MEIKHVTGLTFYQVIKLDIGETQFIFAHFSRKLKIENYNNLSNKKKVLSGTLFKDK